MAVCPEKCVFCGLRIETALDDSFFSDESRPLLRWRKDAERQLSIWRAAPLSPSEHAAGVSPYAGSSPLAPVSFRLPALPRWSLSHAQCDRLEFRRRISRDKNKSARRAGRRNRLRITPIVGRRGIRVSSGLVRGPGALDIAAKLAALVAALARLADLGSLYCRAGRSLSIAGSRGRARPARSRRKYRRLVERLAGESAPSGGTMPSPWRWSHNRLGPNVGCRAMAPSSLLLVVPARQSGNRDEQPPADSARLRSAHHAADTGCRASGRAFPRFAWEQGR